MTPPAEALPPDPPPAGEESLHRALGLTDDEFEAVGKILGRPPNHLELALYAVMWSEHCSYKSSRLHLRRLPTEGPRVLVGPGENAGVIDAGDGIAVAIRIESHNHPSAIEPYQGAATGVGGILPRHLHHGGTAVGGDGPALLRATRRRPPALAGRGGGQRDLRLRQLRRRAHRRRRADLRPLLRPEPARQRALHGRPPDRAARARHRVGPGQPGRAARFEHGRDGIGGVSVLASAGFSGDEEGADDTKRPSVQVGDPFEEKRLIEACLELLDTKLVVGIQDLGGAGLACATSETAGRGGVGMDVDVAAVPRREEGMDAVGGDDEREPGAHARHRDPGVVAGGGGHLRQVGGAGHRHRHGHRARSRRRRSPAHPRRQGRPRAGRRAGRLALRRRAALRPPAARADAPAGRATRPARPTAPPTCWLCCARRAGSTASTTTSSS